MSVCSRNVFEANAQGCPNVVFLPLPYPVALAVERLRSLIPRRALVVRPRLALEAPEAEAAAAAYSDCSVLMVIVYDESVSEGTEVIEAVVAFG